MTCGKKHKVEHLLHPQNNQCGGNCGLRLGSRNATRRIALAQSHDHGLKCEPSVFLSKLLLPMLLYLKQGLWGDN